MDWKDVLQNILAASKAGVDKTAFIMNGYLGFTTDISREATLAVTKLEAIVTQRSEVDGCGMDAVADWRFCFFFDKGKTTETRLQKERGELDVSDVGMRKIKPFRGALSRYHCWTRAICKVSTRIHVRGIDEMQQVPY